MDRSLVIPLPLNSVASAAKGETKRAVGLYPCFNDGLCDQFILIKLDRQGYPYGTCSPHEVNIHGCSKRSLKAAQEDIPEQTFEAYQQALDRVGVENIPDAYIRYLENAWVNHKPEQQEPIEEADDASICIADGA